MPTAMKALYVPMSLFLFVTHTSNPEIEYGPYPTRMLVEECWYSVESFVELPVDSKDKI